MDVRLSRTLQGGRAELSVDRSPMWYQQRLRPTPSANARGVSERGWGPASAEERGQRHASSIECRAIEETMLKDLQHAARMLWNAKGWTTVVVLSLALGIGANTALFSAINGLLLTRIPVKDPDSLVRFRYAGRNDMVTSSSDYGFVA